MSSNHHGLCSFEPKISGLINSRLLFRSNTPSKCEERITRRKNRLRLKSRSSFSTIHLRLEKFTTTKFSNLNRTTKSSLWLVTRYVMWSRDLSDLWDPDDSAPIILKCFWVIGGSQRRFFPNSLISCCFFDVEIAFGYKISEGTNHAGLKGQD